MNPTTKRILILILLLLSARFANADLPLNIAHFQWTHLLDRNSIEDFHNFKKSQIDDPYLNEPVDVPHYCSYIVLMAAARMPFKKEYANKKGLVIMDLQKKIPKICLTLFDKLFMFTMTVRPFFINRLRKMRCTMIKLGKRLSLKTLDLEGIDAFMNSVDHEVNKQDYCDCNKNSLS